LSNYRLLVQKLTVSQPLKKFLAFYGIRKFIAAFTTAPPPVLVVCHSNPFNVSKLSLENNFNIIKSTVTAQPHTTKAHAVN